MMNDNICVQIIDEIAGQFGLAALMQEKPFAVSLLRLPALRLSVLSFSLSSLSVPSSSLSSPSPPSLPRLLLRLPLLLLLVCPLSVNKAILETKRCSI